MLLEKTRYAAGIESLARAIELVPDYTKAYTALGDFWLFIVLDSEEAIANFESALSFDPGNPAALFGKAVALNYLEKNIESNITLDRLLANRERWDDFGQALAYYYRDQIPYYQGYNHYLSGSLGEARDWIDQAKQSQPESEMVSYVSGLIYLRDHSLPRAGFHADDLIILGAAIGGMLLLIWLRRRFPPDRALTPYFVAAVFTAIAHGVVDYLSHGTRVPRQLVPEMTKFNARALTDWLGVYEEAFKLWAEWFILLFLLRLLQRRDGRLGWAVMVMIGSLATLVGLWATGDTTPYVPIGSPFVVLRNPHTLFLYAALVIGWSVAVWMKFAERPRVCYMLGLGWLVLFGLPFLESGIAKSFGAAIYGVTHAFIPGEYYNAAISRWVVLVLTYILPGVAAGILGGLSWSRARPRTTVVAMGALTLALVLLAWGFCCGPFTDAAALRFSCRDLSVLRQGGRQAAAGKGPGCVERPSCDPQLCRDCAYCRASPPLQAGAEGKPLLRTRLGSGKAVVAQGGELDTDAAGNSTSVRSHLDSFGEFKPRSYDLVLERSDSAPGTHWRPLMGLGAATYLHWPALVSPVHYLSDIRQCLNWAAYHSNSFQDNDLLLRFAHHNETLFQNALYWLGTWFVDAVFLSKLVAVVGYGLGALLFFYIGKAAFGLRGGFLTAIFWTFFPDSWDYFIGGFSKMWMIPMLGLAVYLIDQKKWRIYAVAMPISAILYPVIPVHMGLTLAVHAAFALFRREPDRRPMILNLVLGSVAAILALATKYVSPPDFIGGLTPGSVLEKMPEMYRGGLNTYLPVSPVHEDILSYIDHPFTVIASIVYLVLLGRNIVWHRSWTSLAVASIIGYVIADFLFMQRYVPNRYTRNTALVLLALWNGGNSDALAGRIPWRPLRYLVLAALFAVARICVPGHLGNG